MSDKCPKCGSAALSPDHPKWFECGTMGDRRGTFHHTTTCHHFSEFRKPLDERIKRLEEFARTIANDFDHDNDAHKYGTICRVCYAEDLLKEAKP